MNTIHDLVSMTCNSCGKKIAEVKLTEGVVSIMCPKCGTVNVQETKTTTKNVQNVR